MTIPEQPSHEDELPKTSEASETQQTTPAPAVEDPGVNAIEPSNNEGTAGEEAQMQTTVEPAASVNEGDNHASEERKQRKSDKIEPDDPFFAELDPDSPQAKCKHLYPYAVDMLEESKKTLPVRSASKPRGRPFKKGESGNPLGKPKGCRNRSSLLLEEMIEGKETEILSKIIDEACKGNPSAWRALTPFMLPLHRERPVRFEMRRIETIADAVGASADLIEASVAGEVPPDLMEKFQALIAFQVRMIESAEAEARVIDLENNSEKE